MNDAHPIICHLEMLADLLDKGRDCQAFPSSPISGVTNYFGNFNGQYSVGVQPTSEEGQIILNKLQESMRSQLPVIGKDQVAIRSATYHLHYSGIYRGYDGPQ